MLFLCHYLAAEPQRREVHEGLNVVEARKSANGFIFFGKGGDVASNRLDDQEVSVHTLLLLQSCLVYVNALMLRCVPAEPARAGRMTRAGSYPTFNLDMDQRLDPRIAGRG